MSLSESIASAYDASQSTTTDVSPATVEVPATGTPETPATPTAEPGLIGIQEDAKAPDNAAWKFAEGVTPDTQVAVDLEGKPIYAKDVQASYFRQADYTRKTQEAALIRDQFPKAAQWFEENAPHLEKASPLLQALASGNPEVLKQTIARMAEENGVTLRARGEDGRFVAQQQEPQMDLVDLEALREQGFEPGTAAYDMAERSNALTMQLQAHAERYSSLESKLDGFLGNVQQQQQQIQVQNELSQIAQGWAGMGFSASVEGAMQMVGKPISPGDAMKLANYEALMQHNAGILQKRGSNGTPNTPTGTPTQPNFTGMSLSERIAAQFSR